ncbi:PIN domain-containing protein [Alphaproteobacteria bacterium GH1-50]|uniref:PIN domain-containing protein n=1 Tax=Kangsaoukella pontilimi TaxID=2691042 RepID=A0A7C9MEE8_9RHOB|nr:PIN domain-containing protein [Kangsaoukella pontilimi]MXQ06976.1 PIN domain-containing protein [Kangsaoukella pontilimi]
MKVLIDANVLFPTVLRQIVMGLAERGYFTPLWSERILEEWRRAAVRVGDGPVAEAEIAALKARFPDAMVPVPDGAGADLSLPDPDDTHVLAAAIAGGADELLTQNLKDFPTNVLSSHGIVRRDPDGFTREAWHADPDGVGAVVADVLRIAGAYGIDVSNPRAVLKRARLPRLGKALYAS